MKYLKRYKILEKFDSEPEWDKYVDEVLSELSIEDYINNTNLYDYYDSISDKDMINEYGTSNKNLHQFLSEIKTQNKRSDHVYWQYRMIFYNKIIKVISKYLENYQEDSFLGDLLIDYFDKKGYSNISNELISNSKIYEIKEKTLLRKLDENIKKYIIKIISETPEIYYKNSNYIDPYMENDIPGWIKSAGKFNL